MMTITMSEEKPRCGIILKPKLSTAVGVDDLNEQVPHADAGEMSVGRKGVAWFGRFGRFGGK
jgi:hypothetical protein